MVGGRRFRPTSGQLEFISVFIVLVQQRSEQLVEEWNMPATIRIIGRRAGSVVGCKQVFSVLMDAAVLACTFPRPSVVVKYNQLYSEMRNVRACFYDVTTRMLCFCIAEHRSGKSIDFLQTGEFTVTLLCFCRDSFQCSCMRIVARLFFRVSSISAHGSGRDHSFGRCV